MLGASYCWQKSIPKYVLKRKFSECGYETIACKNFDVWVSLRRSFILDEKYIKSFLPNPFYFLRDIFRLFSELLEKYLPVIGYNSLFIGRKN